MAEQSHVWILYVSSEWKEKVEDKDDDMLMVCGPDSLFMALNETLYGLNKPTSRHMNNFHFSIDFPETLTASLAVLLVQC